MKIQYKWMELCEKGWLPLWNLRDTNALFPLALYHPQRDISPLPIEIADKIQAEMESKPVQLNNDGDSDTTE